MEGESETWRESNQRVRDEEMCRLREMKRERARARVTEILCSSMCFVILI